MLLSKHGVRQARPMAHASSFTSSPNPTADMRWEGPTEASGARAARMLPCCFSLLEACIEALAADTQVHAMGVWWNGSACKRLLLRGSLPAAAA